MPSRRRAGDVRRLPRVTPPNCPSCGQPATTSLAGAEHDWECRNEACPEFGQPVAPDEPDRPEEKAPEPPRGTV